jgi:LEA14-like dessication related protein
MRLFDRIPPLRFALIFSLVAVCGDLAGCADMLKVLNGADFQTPAVTFERAMPRDLALDRVTIDVTFRIDNPNNLGVDLARLAYDLQIEGHSILSGKPELGVRIPAKGSGELVFPCTIQYTQLADGLQAALSKKIIHWRASGEAGVNSPIGIIALPLSAEGDIVMPSMPGISLQTPRVASSGFTSARIIFPIAVTNPNSFAIPFAGVSGVFTLQGARIGTASSASRSAAIAAHSAQTVELALDVSYLSAGAAVASAIANGSADVSVIGEADLAGFKLALSVQQHVELGK